MRSIANLFESLAHLGPPFSPTSTPLQPFIFIFLFVSFQPTPRISFRQYQNSFTLPKEDWFAALQI